MRVNAALRAWQRWQAAAGPWVGWSVCPALQASDGVEAFARNSAAPQSKVAAHRCASALAPQLAHGGVLVMLDLEAELGVHIAAELNSLRLAYAVLVLPRWPYAHAVLPTAELVRALLAQSPRLSAEPPLPNAVFVLDAKRTTPLPGRPKRDPRADNRYRLAASDLPDLAELRARGIARLLKLHAR